jgi:two-component sensor histidine kinase
MGRPPTRRTRKPKPAVDDPGQAVADLQRELSRKNAELEALRRIGEATGSAFGSREMLQAMAEVGRRVTGTDLCEIYLATHDGKELVLRASTENQDLIGKVSIGVGEGITGLVAQERRSVGVSRKAYKDPRAKYYPLLREEDYESFLAVPLVVRDRVIGVITVRTHEPHQYRPDQEMLLASVAGQVAGSLRHLDHVTRLEHQVSQFRALADLSRRITSAAYLEEVLQLLVSETAQRLNYRLCTLRLLDEESQELILRASHCSSRAYVHKPSIRLGQSVAGVAVKENRTVTVVDVQTSKQYMYPEVARKEGVRSLICVPLRVADHVIGVFSCYTDHPHEFTPDEIRTLETLAGQAAIAVSHARLTARDTLMQEMHHRVKNNLQQVVSLLRMQLRHAGDKSLDEHLNECLNRIQAMASVHDLLSRDDLEHVRLRSIQEAITQHLIQGFAPPRLQVRAQFIGDDILLPMNQANHIALVLNELVQNAIQHGFAGRGSGRIEIETVVDGEDIRVAVRNDGEPLPEGFALSKQTTMGLQICTSLVRSGLGGKFTMTRGEMTEAAFSFVRGPS